MGKNNSTQPFAISKKVLLSVYAIAPFMLFLIFLDTYFFHFFLKNTLTLTTTNSAIYILFLELPHIIGSFIGYADAEYVQFYRKKLFIYLPLLLSLTFFVIQINLAWVLFSYLIYTMYHNIKQQTGIARLLVGSGSYQHEIWSYSAFASAIIGNVYVFLPQVLGEYSFTIPFQVLTFCIPLMFLTLLLYLSILPKKSIGCMYVIAITLMLFAAYICISFGYFFFAIFITRFVHDVTAFIFYSVHDSNRNAVTAKNFFYKFFTPLHIPSLLITPVLGVFIAYLLQQYGIPFSQSASLIILSGFTHYYIESFMWKRDSIHRNQLRFVA